MFAATRDYLIELAEDFGQGWNGFWFEPRDAYTLSVMRILLGGITLFWIATFTPDLQRFFGPAAIISPYTLVLLGDASEINLSYFNLLSTPGAVWAGHVFGMLVVGLFTLGVATRATSILAALVVLSYIDRTWVLASSFEAVLAMLMIYMCIGPAGNYLSVDAWWRSRRDSTENKAPAASVFATLSTRLIQVHLTIVYFMLVVAKLRTDDWWAGQAIGWMWSRPAEHRLIDLSGLLAYPYVFNFVTHAIVAFEMAFVVLVWVPRLRPLMLVLSAGVWLLLGLTTGLTAFCALMLVANLAFVSPEALRTKSAAGR